MVHQSLDIAQVVAVELSARMIRNDVDLLVTKGWIEPSGSTKGRS